MDSDENLIVLDRQETPLGYLTKAKNVEIRERLNEESLLSFEIRFEDDETNYLEHEGYVICEGQQYVIKNIEPSSNQSTRYLVQCTHVYIEMLDEYIDRIIELIPGTCQEVAEEILQDSEFTLSLVDVNGSKDVEISEMSILKALQMIREKWDCDLWFNNRNVFLGNKGINKGVEIRYGKNLKSLRSPSSSNDVITRLYLYGQDGLTIEGVNNGEKYIDSPNIGLYRKPKIASIKFNDITDPEELLIEGEKHLRKNDTIQLSYQVDFIELTKQGYEGDGIELGDEVTLTHLPLNLQTIGARVVEYVRYPYESKLGYVTLSSFVESTIDDFVKMKKRQGDFETYSEKRDVEYSETKQKVDNGEIYVVDKYGQVVVNEDGVDVSEIAGYGIVSGGTISIENFNDGSPIYTTIAATNNDLLANDTLTLTDASHFPTSASKGEFVIHLPGEDVYIEGEDRPADWGWIGRLIENLYLTWTGKSGNTLTGVQIWQPLIFGGDDVIVSRINSGLPVSEWIAPVGDVVVSPMTVIMPNGVKHNLQEKRFENQDLGAGITDIDGWEFRYLYVDNEGEIQYYSAGTSGGGQEYPPDPPDNHCVRIGYLLIGYGTQDPDGDINTEKDFSTVKPNFKQRIYHDNRYRDERLVRANKNDIALGGTPYGSETISLSVTGKEYETYYLQLGKGKRSASISITRTDGTEYDAYTYGASLVVGRKSANNADGLGRSVWGTYVDSSGNAGQVTGRREGVYGAYILDPKVFGKSYTYLYDTDLMPHPDEPEVIALKLTFYNRSSSVTEDCDLKVTWHAL
ncbi:prophage endopeptidase tail family protein [Chengkuizengella marina]|uniref:Phage minor structural protein, N-terminal region n=1 Tax=Chengkuizengella marina TaxID=2507566 RepID=A0A6N9Q8L5_9BACL|nr:prophage endopeptidase tail family protein [Chengkuizengella marina]NBI31236.1 hypothetical protein [Chengkuizengella marina]